MQIAVACSGCNAKYQIDAKYAGKTATCKHCGAKFDIPGIGDHNFTAVEESPSLSAAGTHARSSAGKTARRNPAASVEGVIALKPADDAPDHGDVRVSKPLLPPIISEAFLPLLLALGCIGWAGYILVRMSLDSANPTIAFILLALAAALYLLVVMPLSQRAVESAAKTADVELPNSVWLQTFALISIPTAGLIAGFQHSGWSGMAMGGGIGVVVMTVLMPLLFNAPPAAALLTGLFGGLWYAIGGAASAAALGIVVFLLSITHFTMPWQREPTEIAAAAPQLEPAPPSPPPEPVTPPQLEPIELAPAPAPAPTPEPPPAEPSGPTWLAAADPPAQRYGWTLSAQQSLPVRPPIDVIHSYPPSPFVAVLSDDRAQVFDMRTTRLLGSIRENLKHERVMLHPSGKYLVSVNTGRPPGAAQNVARSVKPAARVFAVADGRVISTFNIDPPMRSGSDTYGVWFAGDDQIAYTSQPDATGVLFIRDLRHRVAPQTMPLERFAGDAAISPGGRFLASFFQNKITIHDLRSGKTAGEVPIAVRLRYMRNFSFSPDGSLLAMLVDSGSQPWQLIVVDMTSGSIKQQLALQGGPTADWKPHHFQWLADGKGFIIGSDLIDLASGQVFYTLGPETSGSLSGRAVTVLWPEQALYEFLPQGTGSRLVYRGIPLPKEQLANALRVLRNEEDPLAFEIAQAEPAMAPDGEETSAVDGEEASPAPPAVDLTTLTGIRKYEVTIVSVDRIDAENLAAQLEQTQARLKQLDSQIARAERDVNRYSNSSQSAASASRNTTTGSRASTQKELAAAKAELRRLTNEQREAKGTISRLQREHAAAQHARIISARLDDGTPCFIDVETQPLAVIADLLTPDRRCEIDGLGQVVEGDLRIKPRTIQPVQ